MITPDQTPELSVEVRAVLRDEPMTEYLGDIVITPPDWTVEIEPGYTPKNPL